MPSKRALIIEDKDYLSDIIATCLNNDFECIQLYSKEEALAHKEKADIAILSTNIRGARTEDLLSDLKVKFGIPVLILTSNNTSLIRIQMLELGADDVMTKPFNPDELRLRMLNLVKRNK